VLCGVLRQVAFRSAREWRELHVSNDFLAALGALDRPANDRRARDCGCEFSTAFDLGGIDIFSEANDQFPGSADDKEISVFQTNQIAGVEPSLGINGGGGFLGAR